MRKIILTCLLVCAFLSTHALAAEEAQPTMPTVTSSLSFEVGYEVRLDGMRAPYVLSRYNIPLGAEVFGAQSWLLPEAGVFLYDQLEGYVRVQFIVETDYAGLFADCRYEFSGDGSCRAGARFGF